MMSDFKITMNDSPLTGVTTLVGGFSYEDMTSARAIEKRFHEAFKPSHDPAKVYLHHGGIFGYRTSKRRARIVNGVMIFIVDRRQAYYDRLAAHGRYNEQNI